MRYSVLLLTAICVLLLGSMAQHPTERQLIKDYVFIPSGNIGDTIVSEFYISSIEITNAQYRIFLNDLADSGSVDKLAQAAVDSTLWERVIGSGGPKLSDYFRNTSYDDYPVVNISKRGAELYCQWLTDRYNKTGRPKVQFSLPTEQQWEYAARGGNPKAIYPWSGTSLILYKKGKYHDLKMANYLSDSTPQSSPRSADHLNITAPVRTYQPNTYEIYNLAGNVSEILCDRPYTKGGSYLSPAKALLISAHEDTDTSRGAPYIGFRPVMIYEGSPH